MAKKSTQPKRQAPTRAEAYRIIVREKPDVTAPELMVLIKDFGYSLTKETVHNALSVARKQVANEPPPPRSTYESIKEAAVPPEAKAPDQSAAEKLIRAAKELGLEEANRILKAIVE